MKKIASTLSIAIFIAFLLWQATKVFLLTQPINAQRYVSVGNLQIGEGTVLEFRNQAISVVSGGGFILEKPIVSLIDNTLLIAASITCLLAAIALRRKAK
jgi:hypothetical protein